MEIAEVTAKRSTCFRGNVGAILVLDNNIISQGYNGPPSKEPHCKGNHCELVNKGCKRSIHAEVNAYLRAPEMSEYQKSKVHLYCTHQPCLGCAQVIVDNNTQLVVFMHPYRKTEGLELLKKEGVGLIRMTPSGYMVDMNNNEVLLNETY